MVLDKLYLHQAYLRRRFAWKILFQLLNQFSQSLPQIQQILLITPHNTWIEAKSLQLGFQRIVSSPICSVNDPSSESLLLHIVENNQALYNILAYLKSRIDGSSIPT